MYRGSGRSSGTERIETTAPGYVLAIEGDDVDLFAFRRWSMRLGARRRMSRRLSAAQLREALCLWRGEPLVGLEFEPFAQLCAASAGRATRERVREECVELESWHSDVARSSCRSSRGRSPRIRFASGSAAS